jgi:hypothetical protein
MTTKTRKEEENEKKKNQNTIEQGKRASKERYRTRHHKHTGPANRQDVHLLTVSTL